MPFKYKEYSDSDEVKKAALELAAKESATPEYKSGFEEKLTEIMSQIENRKKFSYDVNADPMYMQYKDAAKRSAKAAAADSMGQAASLTGGYGNSWAQSVAQQNYNKEMQKVNDMIPTLYEAARAAHDRDTQDLYNLYGLYSDREAQDYGRFRDKLSDHYTELDYLRGKLDSQRSFDYGKHSDAQSFAYQVARDAVADSQWQKEYDRASQNDRLDTLLALGDYDALDAMGYNTSALRAQSGSGNGSDSIKAIKERLAGYKGNPNEVYNYIKQLYESNIITESEADELYAVYADENYSYNATDSNKLKRRLANAE